MRTTNLVTLSAALLAAGAAMTACGDDDRRPSGSAPSAGPTTSVAVTSSSAGGAGGAGTGGASTGGAGTGGATSSAGTGGSGWQGATLADTACAAFGGVNSQLFAQSDNVQEFDTAIPVGPSLVVGSDEGSYLMDNDGTNLNTIQWSARLSLNAIVSEGVNENFHGHAHNVWAMVGTGAAIRLQRFRDEPDEGDTPDQLSIGPHVALSNDVPIGIALSSDQAGELGVFWATLGRIRSRFFDDLSFPKGDQFDVQVGAYTQLGTVVAAYGHGKHLVAWAGSPLSEPEFLARSVAVTASGPTGNVNELLSHAQSFSVERLVATDSGFLLLYTGPAPEFYPLVQVLDQNGAAVGEPVGLEGAAVGWDLASQGGQVGVVATRTSGEPEFRPINDDGTPAGDWVCLSSAVNAGTNAQIAISPIGSGYAATYRDADGNTVLARFDAAGTGMP